MRNILSVLFVVACIVGGVWFGMNEFFPDEPIPPCTDSIAEAGGICVGPLIEEVDDYSDVDSELR